MKEAPRLDAAWSFVFNGTLAYISIVAVHQAVLHFRLSREKELRLRQSQLQLLKAQLRPHFLFNTLNTVASLVYTDQAEAERTVVNLSDMLRVGLSNMRARLKYLYGPDYRLELLSRDGGGTTASVRLPFREEHEEAPDAREAVMSYRHVGRRDYSEQTGTSLTETEARADILLADKKGVDNLHEWV